MSNYKFTEEYRERFAFNKGDMFLLKEALTLYADKAREEVQALEKEGKRSVIGPEFYQQMANDALLKLDAWTEKPARD